MRTGREGEGRRGNERAGPCLRSILAGAGPPKVDLLDPKGVVFEPYPLNPPTKTPVLAWHGGGGAYRTRGPARE